MPQREISLVDKLKSTKEGRRGFYQERAIVRVTDQIEATMKTEEVSRAELARRLGRTPGWVTQLLDGERNKTIRTIADVYAVLGYEFLTGRVPLRVESTTEGEYQVPAEWPDEHEWQATAGQVTGLPKRFDANLVAGFLNAT